MSIFAPSANATEDFLSAEQFMRGCDHIWSTDRRCPVPRNSGRISGGDIVYAKVDHLPRLFQILRRQRGRVVLVTSESDLPISAEMASERPSQVAVWFSTNSLSPEVRALPLGFANSYCAITLKPEDLSKESQPRTKWLYVNFRPESHPEVRQAVWDDFATRHEDWVTQHRAESSMREYADELLRHRFVLCPRGNGIDTHRMWEALAAGTIPVVKRTPALDAFADLPIYFVEDFRSLTLEELHGAYETISTQKWPWERLRASWWWREFHRARETVRVSGTNLSWKAFLPGYFRSWKKL